MNYAHYSKEDFLMDDYFLQWVKQPNAQSERFWQGFLRQHPHQREVVDLARLQLLDLKQALEVSWSLSQTRIDEMCQNIEASIRENTEPASQSISKDDADDQPES